MYRLVASGLIFFNLLFSSGASTASDLTSFEGCVDFRIEVEERSPKLPQSVLEAALGHSVTKCFRRGEFKWTYEGGSRFGTIWYQPDTNLEYTLEPGGKVILVAEVSAVWKAVESVVAEPINETILGYDLTRILIHYDDESSSEYWVAPDLPVIPLDFAKRKIAGQDILYERGQSQVLWAEHVSVGMIRREIAINVNSYTLPEEFFELPNFQVEPWPEP